MKAFVIVLFFLFFFTSADGAIAADEITELPGLNITLPSPQYSGYLDISGGKHLHYWLVTDESNSTTSPLVLWFNGGPGCSSLDGLFYENGPFRIDTSGDAPTLHLNPYRWNLVSNVVFIEAPAGVGLSYADTSEGNSNDDKQQAIDNFEALLKFYEGFPEYLNRKLFITGESYAGMYVPTLALQVLAYNEKKSNDPIALDGIMVGNGVIGQHTGQIRERIHVDYLHGHSLFDDILYKSIVKECGNFSHESQVCEDLVTSMHDKIGRVNIYNVLGDCISSDSNSDIWKAPPTKIHLKNGPGGRGPVACIDGGAAATYLNKDNVRKATHTKSVEEIGEWHVCGGKLKYKENWGSLLPNYKNDIIPKIRVCIFNGDADACVPYNGNEEWTSGLGVSVKKDWHTWQVEGQVAGYVTNYENDFSFITVKGAGHMVPQFKPVQALAMFERFIDNQPF